MSLDDLPAVMFLLACAGLMYFWSGFHQFLLDFIEECHDYHRNDRRLNRLTRRQRLTAPEDRTRNIPDEE